MHCSACYQSLNNEYLMSSAMPLSAETEISLKPPNRVRSRKYLLTER